MSELEHDVDLLLQTLTFGEDPYAGFVARASAEGLPEIQVSTVFGRFLQLLVELTNARLVLEVGTLGGYSAAWMARALPDGGRIISCEIDPHHAEVAAANLRGAGLDGRVNIRVGPALETLEQLGGDSGVAGRVDLAFIDADKENNANYLDLAVGLAHSGTLIIVDNVVRAAGILDPFNSDPRIVGTRAVLQRLGEHPQLESTALQTVGIKGHDGFAIARVR
jgi:predicted O-methyltransferase YrrM